nr:sugar transferase [bacterium]
VSMLLKRAIDRVGALVMITLLSPLFLAIGFLIKISSPGPVFFSQKRSGLRGRAFKMYKFRTMQVGAENEKARLLNANEMNGPVFKIREDPRITRIGKWLRRFSLDELPQIFNVLKGDMSLVGPRPLPVEEARKCDRWEKRRFSIKPGITCLWQISGRNMLDFPEWMKLDLTYVNNWSLALDFKILARTFGAVISGRGAY